MGNETVSDCGIEVIECSVLRRTRKNVTRLHWITRTCGKDHIELFYVGSRLCGRSPGGSAAVVN